VFDSHCHLHDARLIAQADAAIERAKAAGVAGFMLAGVSPSGWRTELELRERHPECAVSYGVHPQLCAELDEPALLAMLDELGPAVRGAGWPRPAALGEVGLDTSTPALERTLPFQERLFRAQLALAREARLPVILHVLQAHGRALELLKQDELSEAGGVVHSYSGSAELVPRYEALGLHVSFSGIVCQPRAKKARAAAARVSPERLLVETDAPDQTPLPHRPASNEPAFLPSVIEELARLRGQSAASVAELTERNARRLFQR
jgi:TatD DNase family protein